MKEKRQGEIRYSVAEEIRKKRSGQDQTDPMLKMITANVEKDPSNDAGVICIGRGAYKEYLRGVNEGWLGPLEAPLKITEAEKPVADQEEKPMATDIKADETKTLEEVTADTDTAELGRVSSSTPEESPKEPKIDKSKQEPVPNPYISQEDYDSIPTPRELAAIESFAPLVYIPHPHILGFTNTPIRSYRYFTQRKLSDRLGRLAAGVALNSIRPFDKSRDLNAGLEEESEWPASWREKSEQKNSDWTQNIVVDDRISSRMRVYEIPADNETNVNSS